MTSRDRIWGALLAMQRMSWEQGVASHAAIDAGNLELAKAFAHDAVVRQDAHGRLGATGDTGLVNGGALMEAVALLGDEGAEALELQRWALLRHGPRDDSGVLWHLDGLPEVWVDTVYMVVPSLVVTGDFAPADMQYRMHKEHLWDASTGLYRHRVNTLTGAAVRGALWATGNGWVAAGLARALRRGGEVTPVEMRARWQRDALALLEACTAWERPDGRFHDVLDHSDTFVDGTAGLMLAYAAFTGVADGWLDASWSERGRRWMDAALAYVGPDGLVREVCGSPHFDKQGTSAEAQAFALLAMSAAEREEKRRDEH